jgi:ribosome-associated toxin RatA of RatAB toxin-antitoxin module
MGGSQVAEPPRARPGLGLRIVLFAQAAGVVLAALVAAQPALADKPRTAVPEVLVQAKRDGEAVLMEARASLNAQVQIAWAVLTDYEHYAEFIPDLRSSQVLSRDGSVVIVEQKGVAGFFFFHFPLEVRLSVTEQPFERVTSQAIGGDFKSLTGVYQLIPEAGRLRVTYAGRLVPGFRLPPFLGVTIMRMAVQERFTALVREIVRRGALAKSLAP